jgi:ubiquinone/menaquinone biosynthesis C-methylase UbiE
MKAEEIYQYAVSNLKEFELWNGYYKRRYIEFIDYVSILGNVKFKSALELGAGIGFGSALISSISEKVTATDLDQIDPETHSPGLDKTRRFLAKLGISNVDVLAASAEEIPMPDSSFDFIFSSHVLEHIPNKRKSLAEVERLLKPGGIFFCVVPTRTERLYSIIAFYISLLKRIPSILFRAKTVSHQPDFQPAAKTNTFSKRSRWFPPVHGTADKYFDEIKNWSFPRWKRMLYECNQMEMIYAGSTQIGPNLIVLGEIFPSFAIAIYSITHTLHRTFGKFFPFFRLGINAVFVLRRK